MAVRLITAVLLWRSQEEFDMQQNYNFCFAPIFTDHMVLQRETNVAVFGKGVPGQPVLITVPQRDAAA